ncbi:hypothetical protein CTAYLR_003221 [Chrysophaeum taylorii]|uniref:Cytidyltransferase-like domain-containing protein n=1 Tax=Chrysophaeum taylorii TaxID=2483200 RepID=A0AAD7UC01_9STRA|nr:hypothetical protein CTAYLR_003221 [Chrysophaeum taylorii]
MLVSRFLAREIDVLYVGHGSMSARSFNPLHQGHLRLADAAKNLCARRLGVDADVVFEMSLSNADKGEIPGETARRRLEQFDAVAAAVVLTRSPLYVDKAALLGPCDFVVGADTASRILDPKYYGETGVDGTLDTILRFGCAFVVAGRLDAKTGQYVAADASLVNAPVRHRDMFATLAESDFRVDISSTELRKKMQQSR